MRVALAARLMVLLPVGIAVACQTGSAPTTIPPPPTTTTDGCTESLSSGDIRTFVAGLAPGESGCVSGRYAVGSWHIRNGGFTLRGPATILGVIYLEGAGTTLQDLSIDGSGIVDVTLTLDANDITISGLDVSNGGSGLSCAIIGSWTPPRRITGARILGSHLHDCGDDPQFEHGIYVDNSDGAYIADNTIEGFAAWGIHFYPDADNTIVEHNTVSGGARSSVIFGSQYRGVASDGNVVRYNILTYPALSYSQTYWGGATGSGNELAFNCVWGAGRGLSDGGPGVSVHDNLVADPASRACAGYGSR